MFSGSFRVSVIFCWLLWAPVSLAQEDPARVNPQALNAIAAPVPAAPLRTAWVSSRRTSRAQAARDLAYRYLKLWSAPNRVTLASASSFYGPTVMFHGRTRTIDSVIAEKRQFAERWPDRIYRYHPGTTQVACEPGGARCTVWSVFYFTADNPPRSRYSLGIGEHELVVSFSSGRPVIASENSRVVRRGRGNMTSLLGEGP